MASLSSFFLLLSISMFIGVTHFGDALRIGGKPEIGGSEGAVIDARSGDSSRPKGAGSDRNADANSDGLPAGGESANQPQSLLKWTQEVNQLSAKRVLIDKLIQSIVIGIAQVALFMKGDRATDEEKMLVEKMKADVKPDGGSDEKDEEQTADRDMEPSKVAPFPVERSFDAAVVESEARLDHLFASIKKEMKQKAIGERSVENETYLQSLLADAQVEINKLRALSVDK